LKQGNKDRTNITNTTILKRQGRERTKVNLNELIVDLNYVI
jgi:hypothetical protein